MSEQHCTGCSGTDYIGRPCRRVLPKGAVIVTTDSLTELMWELVRHVNDDLHEPLPIHAATAAKFIIQAEKEAERRRYYGLGTDCHADRDGDCDWSECPQTRDGEPAKTGRHCPLDVGALQTAQEDRKRYRATIIRAEKEATDG